MMTKVFFRLFPIATVLLLFPNRSFTAETTRSVAAASPSPTVSAVSAQAAKFNGTKAFEHLKAQVDAGPRIPGQSGMEFTRNLIRTTLKNNGFAVGEQKFTVQSPLLGSMVEGINFYGVYPAGAKVKYIISAHYDTRPFADQDPDPAKRSLPVPGANDGASGVAALLELSRVIPTQKLPHGVALVFFDVEDHGVSGGPNTAPTFALGSDHMAKNLPAELRGFEVGINLDMIGDKELSLPMEGYSLNRVPKVTHDLWNKGAELFPETWIKERGPSIYDDHMPFLARNFQYIDVIDFTYEPWHTTADTVDKCSPQSLEKVGLTVQQFILK